MVALLLVGTAALALVWALGSVALWQVAAGAGMAVKAVAVMGSVVMAVPVAPFLVLAIRLM